MSYTDTNLTSKGLNPLSMQDEIEDLKDIFDFLILSVGKFEEEIPCQDVYARGICRTLDLCRNRLDVISDSISQLELDLYKKEQK